MAMRLWQFKAASTFDGVANLYHSLTPWREGNEYGTQTGENKHITNAKIAYSLSKHGKRYVTLRPIEYGYAARYHDTDVVIWQRRRDEQGVNHDQVIVQGHSSLSTESFADDFTPANVRFKLHYDDGYYVRVATDRTKTGYWDGNDTARCYEFSGTITFDVNESMAFPVEGQCKTSFIDGHSPMLRVALKRTKYFEFMDYARARLALHSGPITKGMMKPTNLSQWHVGETMDLLDDLTKWDDLLFSTTFANERTAYSNTAWLDDVADHVRTCIYKTHKAVPVREVEWYPWSQFDAQRKLRAKYSWAVY